eukprot:12311228-Alexandrium_andersonii.AAC.1
MKLEALAPYWKRPGSPAQASERKAKRASALVVCHSERRQSGSSPGLVAHLPALLARPSGGPYLRGGPPGSPAGSGSQASAM